MAKKNRWFGWVKRLFVSQEKPKAEKKKSKKCKWVLGRFKFRQYPALPAPEERRVDEAAEKHRKYALTVALATAAAAEAAVAAAQAAAEVVRLTALSQSYITKGDVNLAATKIQSAFRAYLARKALRALKALVKLQALIRGRAVRRKTAFKLRHFQPNEKIRSGEQRKSISTVDSICKYGTQKNALKLRGDLEDKESKGKNYRRDNQLNFTPFECNSQTSWDHSFLSKQDAEAIWFRKQEASLRRERMLKYSFSHQDRRNSQLLAESTHGMRSGRHIYLLEEWAKKEQRHKEEGIENLKPIALGTAQTNVKTLRKQDLFGELNSPPVSFPRRSFGRSKWSTAATESSAPNSPVFPTYMAATQSAIAKARSMSTPKQRVAVQDNFFDRSFSHKNDPLVWSSYNGESFGRKGKVELTSNILPLVEIYTTTAQPSHHKLNLKS